MHSEGTDIKNVIQTCK